MVGCNYSRTQGTMCQQHLCLQGMFNLHDCPHHHTGPICCLIDDVYYAALDDPTERLNAVTLWQLVTHICSTYAQISRDLDDNVTSSNQGMIPTFHLPSTHKSWRSAKLLHKTQVCPSPRKWSWWLAPSMLSIVGTWCSHGESGNVVPSLTLHGTTGRITGWPHLQKCMTSTAWPPATWPSTIRQLHRKLFRQRNGCIAGQLGKHIHPEEQYDWQAGHDKPATGKNCCQSYWGHRKVEGWHSTHRATIGAHKSSHWRSTKTTWNPTGYCWTHCEFKVVGSDKLRESITELCRWSS